MEGRRKRDEEHTLRVARAEADDEAVEAEREDDGEDDHAGHERDGEVGEGDDRALFAEVVPLAHVGGEGDQRAHSEAQREIRLTGGIGDRARVHE